MSALINIRDVSKGYGSQDVLSGITWRIVSQTRVALVGRNGAGKTTLFRLIAGDELPDSGQVTVRPGVVVASMDQELPKDSGQTLHEEAAKGVQHLQDLQDEFVQVSEALGQVTEDNAKELQRLMDRYAYLEERLRVEDAYSADARVNAVLTGLHFSQKDLDRPLRSFSGGQKSRVSLARVLLQGPDVLLLDEPTNHLDLEAIEWLESFLLNYKGAFLLVSHDKVFLNRLAQGVAEVRYEKLHHYQGDYDAFLDERERRLEEHAKKYEEQREIIQRTETFIKKNIARASTSNRAKSRRNVLERMDRLPPPEWPASSIHMRLPEPSRAARIVFEGTKLGKRYGDVTIFKDLDFVVQRGQKIGLVGLNGVGKTTLIRLLTQTDTEFDGQLKVGPGVQVGYFEQEQRHFQGTASVLETLWALEPHWTEGAVRSFLASFLFRGKDVYKTLHQISGGERSRLAMASLVLEKANVLILDEPTNHLDLESRAVMEMALRAFKGTILVATHDRALLQGFVDTIFEMHTDGFQEWPDYESFQGSRQVAKTSPKPPQSAPKKEVAVQEPQKGRGKQQHRVAKQRKSEEAKLRRRVTQAEDAVTKADALRSALLNQMADPQTAVNTEEMSRLSQRLKKTETAAKESLQEWERLSARLEAFLDQDN